MNFAVAEQEAVGINHNLVQHIPRNNLDIALISCKDKFKCSNDLLPNIIT